MILLKSQTNTSVVVTDTKLEFGYLSTKHDEFINDVLHVVHVYSASVKSYQ